MSDDKVPYGYIEPNLILLRDLIPGGQMHDGLPEGVRQLAIERYKIHRTEVSAIIGNLELAWNRGWHTGTLESKAKVKRLEVALVVRDVKNDRLRADGMEAAAMLFHALGNGFLDRDAIQGRIRAAVKQLTGEAGSREFVSPASPSPGSASPVDSREHKKLVLEAEMRGIRRYAWWKDGVQYVGCGNYTLHDALAPLLGGVDEEKVEANANNAAHRDGGYGKETK